MIVNIYSAVFIITLILCIRIPTSDSVDETPSVTAISQVDILFVYERQKEFIVSIRMTKIIKRLLSINSRHKSITIVSYQIQ